MKRMPALFVGHGSPMNAIEDNDFTRTWERLGAHIGRPEAILSVSAHWFTRGTWVSDAERPRQIYDMYGFPKELYELRWPAEGSYRLAHQVRERIRSAVEIDNSWGIDHGTWSVLCRMYPAADVPVVQLSIDGTAPAETHYRIGRELASLRDEGVLLLGSGNIVHDLARIDWENEGGYPWADEFDSWIRDAILAGDHEKPIQYETGGSAARQAFRTPEHYLPLLYVLGAVDEADVVTVFNEARTMGSISMTGYLFDEGWDGR